MSMLRSAIRAIEVGVWLAIAAAAVGAPTPLRGQAPPPITRADREIYAAARDSTAFPDEPDYVLLEEGIFRVEDDDTYSTRLRVVRQALTSAAADRLGEQSFSYDAGRETFHLDWARIVHADGTVVRAEPVHVQVLDQPVARGAPIYTDRKVVRASLGDLSAGDILDLQISTTTDEPLPGDVWFPWTVNGLGPVHRTHMVLDVPLGFEPRVEERNLPAGAQVRELGGRRTYDWAYDDVAAFDDEPFAAPDSSDVVEAILASGPLAWNDVARWYDGLSADRYAMTPALETKLADLVTGATTLTDSLRAVYRWVAQDVRYVSISLGIGGYQPRLPAEVLSTGVGDCKDKTTLFLTLARHMGVEGYPVLASTGGGVRPDMPSARQFNHMIAAIRPADEWIYLDLTVPYSPFGEVYAGLQGAHGLLVRDDGTGEVVTFPRSDAGANRSEIVVRGAVTADGAFDGTYTEVVTGALQYRIRNEFARTLDERAMTSLERGLAHRVFETARADSVERFDGLDLGVVPRLWAHVVADSALRVLPGLRLLPVNLQRYGSQAVIDRLEEGARRFPIDAEAVFGLREHYSEYAFELPEGWTATDLPADVRADSPFGFYESTYRQDGRTLVITRLMRGKRGVYPADRVGELLEWMKTVYADDVHDIALRVPEGR